MVKQPANIRGFGGPAPLYPLSPCRERGPRTGRPDPDHTVFYVRTTRHPVFPALPGPRSVSRPTGYPITTKAEYLRREAIGSYQMETDRTSRRGESTPPCPERCFKKHARAAVSRPRGAVAPARCFLIATSGRRCRFLTRGCIAGPAGAFDSPKNHQPPFSF